MESTRKYRLIANTGWLKRLWNWTTWKYEDPYLNASLSIVRDIAWIFFLLTCFAGVISYLFFQDVEGNSGIFVATLVVLVVLFSSIYLVNRGNVKAGAAVIVVILSATGIWLILLANYGTYYLHPLAFFTLLIISIVYDRRLAIAFWVVLMIVMIIAGITQYDETALFAMPTPMDAIFSTFLVGFVIVRSLWVLRAVYQKLLEDVEEGKVALQVSLENEQFIGNEFTMLTRQLSHRLLNPLGALRANVPDGSSEAALFDKMVNEIVTFMDRSAVINNLQNVVAITENVLEALEQINVVEIGRGLAQKRGLEFEYKLPNADAEFCTGWDQVRMVLENLLSNAAKYNRPGGKVTMNISKVQNTLRMEVQDNGIGIAAEEQKKIFAPNYRSSAESVGWGVGLAEVAQLVRKLNGRIEVKSVLGQGSTFVVTLEELPEHNFDL